MNVKLLFSFLFALSLLAFAGAQDSPPLVKVSFPKTGKHGQLVKGTLQVTFAIGLHAYQNPTTEPDLIPVVVTASGGGVTLKKVEYPKGKAETVAGEDKPVGVYEGTIKIPIEVLLPKKAGKAAVSFKVGYQQCNEQSCFPPGDVSAKTTIIVK